MQLKLVLLLFLFYPLSPDSSAVSNGDEVLGIWQTQDNEAKIEIYKSNGVYNGRIVWLKEPQNAEGLPLKDVKNKNKSLRDREVMGIDIIRGYVFDGHGRWKKGKIYNPKTGKTYSSQLKIKRGKLEVRGYLRLPMFGKSITWTRDDYVN